jgi:hypothetical protein
VSARAFASSSSLGIAAAALIACHLVSTAMLVTVMVEVHGGQAEERQMTELMRADLRLRSAAARAPRAYE